MHSRDGFVRPLSTMVGTPETGKTTHAGVATMSTLYVGYEDIVPRCQETAPPGDGISARHILRLHVHDSCALASLVTNGVCSQSLVLHRCISYMSEQCKYE